MSDSSSETPVTRVPRHSVLELRPRSAAHLAGSARRWRSDRLLDGQREVVIEHAGQEYRLRRTMNDKLILTK
jgi:hemin uptake protein HemP